MAHTCVSPILYANIVRWHIEVGPTDTDQSFQCPVFVYTVDMIVRHFMVVNMHESCAYGRDDKL